MAWYSPVGMLFSVKWVFFLRSIHACWSFRGMSVPSVFSILNPERI